ncbi:DUF1963 domain-containing protein [Streptomyces sp. NPDC059575]|uniref:DUF1963 domain-containing protein n=1 Tax=Streptomyces sp. NPDC059575 TaxID=3346872 RepID=UPI0036B9E8EE
MTPELRDRLSPFRGKAIARGIPGEDVERWLGLARPCATLGQGGDGDVVGRFGGPLSLPGGVAEPVHPFVGSIDLAALPDGVTDLPLPPDGQLLLFAVPEDDGDCANMGSVVYVPAGTAVEERDRYGWALADVEEYQELFGRFPQGPMRVTADVSLPYHCAVDLPEAPWSEPLPGHPRAEELVEVWDDVEGEIVHRGPLQLGGYASEEAVYTDPLAGAVSCVRQEAAAGRWDGPVSGDVSDWVLLADWSPGIEGREGATVHWAIQRADLVARRFERVFTTVYWNP